MARVNVYLPDDLAEAAKQAGLNVSRLTQNALRGVLASTATDGWLDSVSRLRNTGTSHDDVMAAVSAAKNEFDPPDG